MGKDDGHNKDTKPCSACENPRPDILRVGMCLGRLCSLVQFEPPIEGTAPDDEVSILMAEILLLMWKVSSSLGYNLASLVRAKSFLNGLKYPVDSCQVRCCKMLRHCIQH